MNPSLNAKLMIYAQKSSDRNILSTKARTSYKIDELISLNKPTTTVFNFQPV